MPTFALLAGLALILQTPPTPDYWGSLTPGPHPVGFQQRWIIDSTRRLPTGKVAGPRYRPVLLNLWYPAARPGKARMRYRDYFEGAERKARDIMELPGYAGALIQYQRGIVSQEILRAEPDSLSPEKRKLLERFLDSESWVHRDAAMARGSFPIVIYFQGAGSSYDDNVALCEYLASQGYLVLGSAFPEEDNQYFGTNVADRSRERDARRLLIEVRRLPNANLDRVTVVGHSAGAQAALLMSSDPSAPIDAVLSLDTTQDYWTLSDRRWSYFTDPVIAARREIRTPTVFFAEPTALFELGDSLFAAPRWYTTVRGVSHNDFITQGNIRRALTAATPAEQTERDAARRSYDGIVRFIGEWLTAQRAGTPVCPTGEGSLAMVMVPPGEKGPTLSAGSVPSPRDLRHLHSTQGDDAVLTAIATVRTADRTLPAAQVDVATALVARLASGPDPERARRFYQRLVAADTAYGEVAEYFKRFGKFFDRFDKSRGLEWWKLAAVIAPGDTAVSKRVNQ